MNPYMRYLVATHKIPAEPKVETTVEAPVANLWQVDAKPIEVIDIVPSVEVEKKEEEILPISNEEIDAFLETPSTSTRKNKKKAE